MLINLHVKNLALIEEADVYFTEGLNILTGETGAGKSIIIGSINLALGAKVTRDIIRENAEYALVELVFQIEKEETRKRMQALPISMDEAGQIILQRKIMNGKSIIKINGETVPLSTVKAVAEILIDLHGQHEHQTLLYKKNHLAILDDYAKSELSVKKIELKESYEAYDVAQKKLEELMHKAEQRSRQISFLEFELRELEEANVKVGEDVTLEERFKKMIHGKKIIEAMTDIYRYTGSSEHLSASDLIGKALKEFSAILNYDKELEDLHKQLLDMDGILNDFNREVADYMADLEFSEDDFNEIEERLNTINHLKSKYGNTIEAILQYKKEKEEELECLLNYENYLEKCKLETAECEKKLAQVSQEVSKIRKEQAENLVHHIKEALQDLNFLNVEFEVSFHKLEHYTKNGQDEMEFMISTNPGEAIRPLGKVASGGELSRIMLAIKTVLSDVDATETLIFDEIDVGISGRTAQMVSEKMAYIARNHQIICITHLPQIAAMADTHFAIEKTVEQNVTTTSIKKLDEKNVIEELARLSGGVEITENVRKSAKEMKELATRTKKY